MLQRLLPSFITEHLKFLSSKTPLEQWVITRVITLMNHIGQEQCSKLIETSSKFIYYITSSDIPSGIKLIKTIRYPHVMI